MILDVTTYDTYKNPTTERVNIPLWQIKIIEENERGYRFKIDDSWTWYYVSQEDADKIYNYIYSKEFADMR